VPLRIGFDMDGTIADFESAFHAVELRLFGAGPSTRAGDPETEEERSARKADGETPREEAPDRVTTDKITSARQARRRRDAVWSAIHATPNFWEGLAPLEPDAVRRIHALMLEHRWEVFFITQRPKTAGDTVQRQTQRWLVAQGFDLPSVLVLGGSRGAAAGALRLDYHVDDSAQNCLDVLSDSRAKPLLVVADQDAETLASARKLGIGTVQAIGTALDVLTAASAGRHEPGVLARLAALVGWRG
jgi:hypothetical protein